MSTPHQFRSCSVLRSTSLKFVFSIFSFIAGPVVHAEPEIFPDSLIQTRLSSSLPSQASIDHLLDKAKTISRTAPDSSKILVHQALELSKKANYPKGQIISLQFLGIRAKNDGDYSSSLELYYTGLALCNSGQYDSLRAGLLNNIATTYNRSGKSDYALFYYQKSLDLFTELDNWQGKIKVFNNLGIFFSSQDEPRKAKEYFFRSYSLEVRRGNPDSRSILRSQYNLGNSYNQIGTLDSAGYWYELALIGFQKIGEESMQYRLQHNLASLRQKQGRLSEALGLYHQSLSGISGSGSIDRRVSTLNNIGLIYLEQKEYVKAISILTTALDSAKISQHKARERNLHQLLSSAYEGIQSFDLALYHLQHFVALDAEQYNVEKDRTIQELQIKYKTEKQAKDLLLARQAQAASRYERNTLLIISGFLIILLGVAIVAYHIKRRDNRRLFAQKEIIREKEQDKSLLLRELHHRVKNNLQLISSLLNLQSAHLKDEAAATAVKEGQARVEAMAIIHRELYLKEENTRINLSAYFERMTRNLVYAFRGDGPLVKLSQQVEQLEIDADLAIPLGLITNELITNSLKYAFDNVSEPTLSIRVKTSPDNYLDMVIADNGVGEKVVKESTDSFGLEMIHSLAEQMDAILHIDSTSGYQVQLRIPFQERQLTKIPLQYG